MDASLSTFLENVDMKDLKKSFKLVERSIMEGTLNNNEKDIIDFLKGL